MAPKRLSDYVHSRPEQLSFFEQCASEDSRFSNTIELYDNAPKYWWGNLRRRHGRYLDQLEREFEHNKQRYQIRISPARLKTKKGEELEYYPSKREELVEDALRKLACGSGRAVFLDDQAGLVFTLYELQQELQRQGHGYNISEIKQALQILAMTKMELMSSDGATVIVSSLLETLGLSTRADQRRDGGRNKCFVRFNQLVTRSIQQGTFRQIDYEVCMRYRSVIARCLHKRLAHCYLQASLSEPYVIGLNELVRDFGVEAAEKREQLRRAKAALEEMVEKGVLLTFKVEKRLDPTNKKRIADVKFTLIPSKEFSRVAHISDSNQRVLEAGVGLAPERPIGPKRK